MPPLLAPLSNLKRTPTAPLKRWWGQQTPQRQDRFAVLAPLAAVVLFLAAILSAFAYLRYEEVAREREAINRDVEYTQQRLRLRLLEQQEQLMRFAREVSSREISHNEFVTRAEAFVSLYPELESLTWIDERRKVRASYGTASLPKPLQKSAGAIIEATDTVTNY